MKIKKTTVSKVLLAGVVLSVILFYMLYQNSQYKVENIDAKADPSEEWSIDKSILNGAPLDELKTIYLDQSPEEITKVFITVFPTKSEEGKLLDFKAFDLHESLNKKYNPILNANVKIVEQGEDLNVDSSLNIVNATIRVRGNSARGDAFKSYNIKFKDGAQTFYGQSVLNLNKHTKDISKIANKFSMDMMSKVEHMASFRTNFMLLYIRDASLPEEEQSYNYYGLYTHVEQPNKNYLRVRGLDENGTMYKATNFEFRLYPELKNITDPEYDQEIFESVLSIREGKDHSKLLTMLSDINDMNQDFEKVFTTYFNEENYLSWLACIVLLGNADTISHNFILYNPQHSLTWYLLPWDYDKTFKFGDYESGSRMPYSLRGIQRHTGVMLHRRYLKQSGNIEKLTAKIEELLTTTFNTNNINFYLNSYKPILENTMRLKPDILLSKLAPNEYSSYLNQFEDHILSNYLEYKEAIQYPTPVFVSEPEKREDGTVYFTWESSYDYQGDLLSYDIILTKDYDMKDIVFQEEGLLQNYYEQAIPEGTYFLAITVTDVEGNKQCSLDYYMDEGLFIYGIRQVKIQ